MTAASARASNDTYLWASVAPRWCCRPNCSAEATCPSYYPAVISDSVVDELRSEGFVRLVAGFDPAAADRMRARWWREFAALGIKEGDPSTWPSGRQGKALVEKSLHTERTFEAFWSKDVVAAIDALLGAGCWTRPATPDGHGISPRPLTRDRVEAQSGVS